MASASQSKHQKTDTTTLQVEEEKANREDMGWTGHHGRRKASSLSNLLEDLINAMVALRISVLV